MTQQPFISNLSHSHERALSIASRLNFLRNLAQDAGLEDEVPNTYRRDEHFWVTAYDEFARINHRLLGVIPDRTLRRTTSASLAFQGATALVERDEKAAKDSKTGAWTKETLKPYTEAFLAKQFGNVGFLFLDVDGFGAYNENHGHENADILLINLVKLLQDLFRTGDMIARVGGDEIAVLLPSNRTHKKLTPSDVLRLGEMARLRIQEQLGITASIGATVAQPGDTFESLYTRADQLMFQGKQSTKNTVISDITPRRMT